MSKIALITDIHLGVKKSSELFAEYQWKFFDEQFIPTIVSRGIKEVIVLGDTFDNRKETNNKIVDFWLKTLWPKLESLGITVHMIVGNHDIASKNTLDVNTPNIFLSGYKNIKIYDKPATVELGGNDFLFVPWICDDNYKDCINAIKASKCSVVFGHFEFVGFDMGAGQIADHGMDHKLLSKYEYVFSGHYHHKSKKDNVIYLGNPFEFTWGDYDDPRGFHIFDTKDFSLEFIQNTEKMFVKFMYDDEGESNEYWKTFDVSAASGKHLRLVTVMKTDQYQYDRLVEACYNSGAADFKIVDSKIDVDVDIDVEEIEHHGTADFIVDYIKEINTLPFERELLVSYMRQKYTEAVDTLG